MRTTTLAAALCLAVSTLACSAPPPPRDKPDAEGSASVAVSQPVDLAPVPAPSGIVARARLRHPAATAAMIAQMSGAPPQAVEQVVRGIVTELLGKRGARLDADPALVAREVSLDGSVDLVVAFADASFEPGVAISFPLRSLDEARANLSETLVETAPGTWGIPGKKARGACSITRAAGQGGGRLVCGASERDVSLLGPYMARTLAAEPSASGPDLVAEVDVAAIDARFGPELRKVLPMLPMALTRKLGQGNAVFDKALTDGGRLLGEEAARLLSDVDKVRIELKAGAETGLELGLTAGFRQKSSWIARSTFATPAGPAPSLFWKGPKDATSGFYTTSADPASYADGIKVAKDLVSGALAGAGVGSEAERKKVAALLDLPLQKGTSLVMYSGSAKLTKSPEPKTSKEKWQRAFGAMSGWSLVGTTLKPDEVSKWLKNAVGAFNQPGIQKAIKGDKSDLTIGMKVGKAPDKLGKGSTAIEVRLQSKVEKSDATLHVFVAPSAEGSWVAMGFEPEEAIARIVAAKDGKDSLEARTDLAPLRQGAATTGYFFSVAGFKSSVLPFLMLRPTPGGKGATQPTPEDLILQAVGEVDALFASLPSKGQAPAFFKTTTTDGKSAEMIIKLPKETLVDLVAVTKRMR
jgi:hypothetical protein